MVRRFERQGQAERSDHLLALGVEQVLDNLRFEPRFVLLLRRVGLPR
jgi:hypothetical protein